VERSRQTKRTAHMITHSENVPLAPECSRAWSIEKLVDSFVDYSTKDAANHKRGSAPERICSRAETHGFAIVQSTNLRTAATFHRILTRSIGANAVEQRFSHNIKTSGAQMKSQAHSESHAFDEVSVSLSVVVFVSTPGIDECLHNLIPRRLPSSTKSRNIICSNDRKMEPYNKRSI